MATMKAVRIHEYGGPEVLTYQDVPVPAVADGEVLIRVYGAGVNPVDVAIRAGYMAEYLNVNLPLVLGCDVSGEIEALGANVTNFKKGDQVYARADVARDGAYGEYVVVRAADVAFKPKTLDHTTAGATPHAALSAWQTLVEAAGLTAGQTALIHGAAGGVGSFAVQFGKMRGARVIGTASQNHLDYVRELGADQVIDYNATRFEEAVRDVDVVLDLVGGETQERSWSVIKKGGALVSLVQPPSRQAAAAHGVHPHFIAVQAHGPQLAQVANAIDAGHIKTMVSQALPLSDARKAHELIQTRHTRGKIVLEV